MTAQQYQSYLRTKHWRAMRSTTMKGWDGYCQICRMRTVRPDIHHLHYERVKNEHPGDLQILCRSCHTKEHELRHISTFESIESFKAYLATLSPYDLNRRFPQGWIPKHLRGENQRARPDTEVIVIQAGMRKIAPRRPRHDPRAFSVLATAGFKCEYCFRPLSATSFQVSYEKASCGCNLVEEYRKALAQSLPKITPDLSATT